MIAGAASVGEYARKSSAARVPSKIESECADSSTGGSARNMKSLGRRRQQHAGSQDIAACGAGQARGQVRFNAGGGVHTRRDPSRARRQAWRALPTASHRDWSVKGPPRRYRSEAARGGRDIGEHTKKSRARLRARPRRRQLETDQRPAQCRSQPCAQARTARVRFATLLVGSSAPGCSKKELRGALGSGAACIADQGKRRAVRCGEEGRENACAPPPRVMDPSNDVTPAGAWNNTASD